MMLLLLKKHLAVLLLVSSSIVSYGQTIETINFPISGLFKVEPNASNPSDRYNYLEFNGDVYSLKFNEEILFSFKTIGMDDSLYLIQQITYGEKELGENADGQTSFKVGIEEISSSQYLISFVFPNRIEKIKITKS